MHSFKNNAVVEINLLYNYYERQEFKNYKIAGSSNGVAT
jgi:hypothetical protein